MRTINYLFQEFPALRFVAVALFLACVMAASLLTRPAPPEKVLISYVDKLNRKDCAGAFALLSQNRKDLDPDKNTLESFTRTFCTAVTGSFTKLFIPDEDIKMDVLGDSADAEYYLCLLPVGNIRRVCAKHTASLLNEDGRWKINRFDIGSWESPHRTRDEKRETLIPGYSPEKMNYKK